MYSSSWRYEKGKIKFKKRKITETFFVASIKKKRVSPVVIK
jgi:hypothetical protein